MWYFLSQYSCIDGRLVEPRYTFTVPREYQLRHWLIRLNLSDTDALSDPAPSLGPRIAWTRLHGLHPRPVYAVDNRSGEVLDFFAVFNAVAATFINVGHFVTNFFSTTIWKIGIPVFVRKQLYVCL